MKDWKQCNRVLCVRADNMGDVIMSGPAMRAVKKHLGCSISLLTSSMGGIITPFMPEIDETIVFNLPWVKTGDVAGSEKCAELVQLLRSNNFDAAIIFTVYSQNPLPAALITYMAGVPNRLAYCRENPYALLTHWVADKEPYTFILHQVARDLSLVAHTGAMTSNDMLKLSVPKYALKSAFQKLTLNDFDEEKEYIVVHAGVSEVKRQYPVTLWIAALQKLHAQTGLQIILTGVANEMEQAIQIQQNCGKYCVVACGLFSMAEFIALIASSPLVISVNTGTVHIACAVQTPVVVLYAQTNPQHTPWKTTSIVLPFGVEQHLQSNNEVIRHVNNKLYHYPVPYPAPEAVAEAAMKMLLQRLKAAG